MECKNSSLCLFDTVPIQTDIIKTTVVDYFPVSSINSGGPIEFHIPGNSEEYIDCNDINLHIKFKVIKGDGNNIDGADKVGLNNLPIATLFQDVILTIGETQVEGGQQTYPYKAYFPTVMEFQPQAQISHMKLFGWYKDEAGKFEDDANAGFAKRKKMIDGSTVCELYGPLYLDFMRQSRYLLSQTDLRLKFIPSKPEFALNAFGTADFKIIFESAVLDVKRVLLNPSVINGHQSGLAKQNALYPLNHTEIITFTIPKGQKSYIKDRLFPLQAPKLLMIAMLENAAFNGAIKKNPFHFQHFDLNKIALYREGESMPGRPFTPDFAKKHYARLYKNTMEAFNYYNTDDTNGLKYDEFANGYSIYAYDLTATNDVSADYRQPINTNNLRLELYFEKDLPETINVLLYAVFDGHIEITRLRDVIASYNR